jgi:hypothetical protein
MSETDRPNEGTPNVPPDAEFSAREGLVAESIEGDTVILDLDGDEYFTLNEVAGAIWPLLEEGADIDELVDEVTNKYEVDSERAREDVETFLSGAVDAGIVTTSQ